MSTAETAPPDVRAPWWVYLVVVIGVGAAAVDLPRFWTTLGDAVDKAHAKRWLDEGRAAEAVPIYVRLHARYPDANELTIDLGVAQDRAGAYSAALATFKELEGVKFDKDNVVRANAAIDDALRHLKQAN